MALSMRVCLWHVLLVVAVRASCIDSLCLRTDTRTHSQLKAREPLMPMDTPNSFVLLILTQGLH